MTGRVSRTYCGPTALVHRRYKARMPTVGSYRFAYSGPVRVKVYKNSCPD